MAPGGEIREIVGPAGGAKIKKVHRPLSKPERSTDNLLASWPETDPKITQSAQMKTRTTRQTRGRRLPPLTIGEMLREEFLKPLEITTAQLRAALPPMDDPLDDWSYDLRWLLDQNKRRHDTDEFLLVDLALALDRVFGMSEGYFLRLWAGCAARSRAWKMRAWLAQAKPLGLTARRDKFAGLAGSVRDLEDTCHLLKSPANAGRRKKAVKKLTTVQSLANWSERQLARAKTRKIRANSAEVRTSAEHPAGADRTTILPGGALARKHQKGNR